jgi:hypothetical protein
MAAGAWYGSQRNNSEDDVEGCGKAWKRQLRWGCDWICNLDSSAIMKDMMASCGCISARYRLTSLELDHNELCTRHIAPATKVVTSIFS